ncbi:MAG TPA: biotin--[acetyl-CoA-carboxylase] ligase [Sphingomicrobium sp.]|nr:biotin--[acetyl-CoA-carboxylase] ligase [Sphingomicrobium sp.]
MSRDRSRMNIRFIEETGSTNADLLADPSAIEGDWLVALRQTSGRGRRGRAWESPLGNLYASTRVTLRTNDPPAQTLSFVAAWSLWGAAGVSCASFKWPNDIMVGDRKLAGILLERSGDIIVAGFGLNVKRAPEVPGRLTTNVDEWRSEAADVRTIVSDLSLMFADSLARWRTEGFDLFRRLWMSEGPIIGDRLKVDLGNGMTVEGAYSGLADDGALKLTLASGKVELVHAGEVSPS